MSLSLRELGADRYAHLVLPKTAALWGGTRATPAYIEDNLELARSAWGKRHFRTFGCYDGEQLTASFKRYERTLWYEDSQLRAMGIGAVYTPDEYRGRGYASAMFGLELDAEKIAGTDIMYLFSDIAPTFYEAFGFVALPSRAFSLRADTLPHERLQVSSFQDRDWNEITTCFGENERERSWHFERTALFWSWLRVRMRQGGEHPTASPTNLLVRDKAGVLAYVLGARMLKCDAFVLDELGFRDGAGAAILPTMLRCAAGDLRRVTGWLPPQPARAFLKRASVRPRRDAIFMAVPLSHAGKRWLEIARERSSGDALWPLDHV